MTEQQHNAVPHAARPYTKIMNEMESWGLFWEILQLNIDTKNLGKNFSDAHPKRNRHHQSASLGYIPGDSTTLFYLTPAVMIRDQATGVSSLEGRVRAHRKRGTRRFYEARAWSPASSRWKEDIADRKDLLESE